MKISAQEEYGLRCLLRLAEAEPTSLTLPEISAAEGLSVAYVAKMMAVLRDAGLIESVRGRSGGYRLAKPPEDIALGSLLLTLGEPLYDDPGYCERHPGVTGDGCVHKGSCSLKSLWLTLETWMRRALDRISLADLRKSDGDLTELLRRHLSSALIEEPSNVIPLTVLKG
jgi:Rrf2 family protein